MDDQHSGNGSNGVETLDLGRELALQKLEDEGRWFKLSIGGELFLTYNRNELYKRKLRDNELRLRKRQKIKKGTDLTEAEWEFLIHESMPGTLIKDLRNISVPAAQRAQFEALGFQLDPQGGEWLHWSEANCKALLKNIRSVREEVYEETGERRKFHDEDREEAASF